MHNRIQVELQKPYLECTRRSGIGAGDEQDCGPAKSFGLVNVTLDFPPPVRQASGTCRPPRSSQIPTVASEKPPAIMVSEGFKCKLSTSSACSTRAGKHVVRATPQTGFLAMQKQYTCQVMLHPVE